MNTANKITIARIILVPIFMIVLLSDFKNSNIIALIVFIIASATDGIDGHIARKYNQITNFGKFMDPLADKFLVTAALLIFLQWGQMPAWAVMLVIAREFAVTGLRLVAANSGVVIAAAWSGKVKTASSIVAICVMLLPALYNAAIFGGFTVNDLCIAVIVITTLWSGVEYFIKNRAALDTKS